MDKFDILKKRKMNLFKSSSDIRDKISQIIDDDSFVELNTFSFAKNEFYNEEVSGLGVVTGYATIDGVSVYVVAQNGKALNGGLSEANCKKITACLEKAYDNESPVIYLLESQGVQVGEGVAVLEGIASLLTASNNLKGVAPQIAIATGDVYGSTALLYANADFTYLVDNACVCYTSPQVIAGSSKDAISKEVIGGKKAVNGATSFEVKNLTEVKESVYKILGVLPSVSGILVENDDDYNRTNPSLNLKICAKCVIDATFDKGTFVELNKNFSSEVIVGIGRVGGISVASIIFDGGEDGVELDLNNAIKIKNFANFANDMGLPLLNFVNVKGIKADIATSSTPVMIEVMNALYNLSNNARISVVYGKAIGLGYSLFASKQSGNSYTYALCTSKISLLDGDAGAFVEFGTFDSSKLDELKEKYAEVEDSFNAAKIGCVDNIIEPQFIRPYVISSLQTLIR